MKSESRFPNTSVYILPPRIYYQPGLECRESDLSVATAKVGERHLTLVLTGKHNL